MYSRKIAKYIFAKESKNKSGRRKKEETWKGVCMPSRWGSDPPKIVDIAWNQLGKIKFIRIVPQKVPEIVCWVGHWGWNLYNLEPWQSGCGGRELRSLKNTAKTTNCGPGVVVGEKISQKLLKQTVALGRGDEISRTYSWNNLFSVGGGGGESSQKHS